MFDGPPFNNTRYTKISENIADTIDVSENFQNDVVWHVELKYDDS